MNTSLHPELPADTPAVLSRATRRGGFTVTELIVAATLLVTVMSVVGSLTVRSGRLWQDSRHYRLALEELSNHLERLASLSPSGLADAIAELSPSPQIQAALHNPVLAAELLTDENGTRVVLHLRWDRLAGSPPVTLVGWINPLPAPTRSPAEQETP